jgi:hypothetical protein
MKTKRIQNSTLLKVGWLPATNTNGARIRFVQCNSKKRKIISGNINLELIDFVSDILDKNSSVKSYSVAVDNTQNNFYLFNVDFVGNSFEDLLNF